ncbi:MAG: gliding motility lipoprotein GldH [Prolixibacteraceae bacterium]|nr:gliding motility lipoprotein GldH [Prolixibacteraceae bacterium]
MKKKIFLLTLGAVLLSFWSCDKSRVFEAYQPIPSGGWPKDSLVSFSVAVNDTVNNYNLFINVRNDISYSYSNLWLFIEITQPGGKAVKDTFEVTLADPSGKWLGNGFGGIKTQQVIYRRNVFFPVSGNYRITLEQGMREVNLKGITNIGIRVEKSPS